MQYLLQKAHSAAGTDQPAGTCSYTEAIAADSKACTPRFALPQRFKNTLLLLDNSLGGICGDEKNQVPPSWAKSTNPGLLARAEQCAVPPRFTLPNTSSVNGSAEAAWDSPFFTCVVHNGPEQEICQNNNSAILWCFRIITFFPWERTRLSLNSSPAVLQCATRKRLKDLSTCKHQQKFL